MMEGRFKRLKIKYETLLPGSFLEEIKVLFNPQTLHYSYAADWDMRSTSVQMSNHAQHVTYFQSTKPVGLSFDLLLDVSMGTSFGSFPGLEFAAVAVTRRFSLESDFLVMREFAARLRELTQLIQVNQELHRPPVCQLTWGPSPSFYGVLTSLDQKLTAFAPSGEPLRAEFSCQFKAVESVSQMRMRELHSADVARRRVIRQGDTLQSIAREAYGDAALWRPIARENHISHPLRLKPGMSLIIPPLE